MWNTLIKSKLNCLCAFDYTIELTQIALKLYYVILHSTLAFSTLSCVGHTSSCSTNSICSTPQVASRRESHLSFSAFLKEIANRGSMGCSASKALSKALGEESVGAVAYGDTAQVQTLLAAKTPVDQANKHGDLTALMIASYEGHIAPMEPAAAVRQSQRRPD